MQTKSASNIIGIDISHWTTITDWSKIKTSGVKFVYSKLTDGLTYVDPSFATNMQAAKSVGLFFGGYHFAHPEKDDPVAEAKHFIDALSKHDLDLIPVLDLESPDDGSIAEDKVISWTAAFLDYFKSATGKNIMIYTGNWYIEMYGNLWSAFKNYPLWIANYTPGISAPPNDGGWTEWTMWQYTESGTIPGISGGADVSVAESIESISTKKTPFSDVAAGSWYEDSIAAVSKNGIMSGYADGTFKPDQPLTRAEAAVIVNHLLYLINLK